MKELLVYDDFVKLYETAMDGYVKKGVIHHFSVDDLLDEIVSNRQFRMIAVTHTLTPVPGEDFFMGFEVKHASGNVLLAKNLSKNPDHGYVNCMDFGNVHMGVPTSVFFYSVLADPARTIDPLHGEPLFNSWFEITIH